jgi:hypothetical protein
VSLITAKNLSAVSLAIIVHRCCWYRRKIFHLCRWHRRSFFSGVNDTGDKFMPVSTQLLIKENPWQRLVSMTPPINLSAVSANFLKKSIWSWWNTQGPWVHWFMKKTKVDNLVRLPLKGVWHEILRF